MRSNWKICIPFGLTGFALFLAVYYWETVTELGAALLQAGRALLVGCVMAYVLNIVMSFYERHIPAGAGGMARLRRPVCILAAIATVVGVVVLLVHLVVPELMASVRLLAAEVPEAVEKALLWARDSGLFASDAMQEMLSSLENIDWRTKVMQLAGIVLEGVGGAAQAAVATVSSVIGLVVTAVIGLIFALYLLAGKERLGSQLSRVMRRYLPEVWDGRVRYVLATLNTCFHKFIVGQCTEAVILGLLCMAGMTLLRFPYAVMVGSLVGFTALIPVAGAYIGAAVGAFMILTVEPMKALAFLVFIVVLQQLEGNLIYPKVVGTSIGLPGVWVLATVTLSGGLFGIGGMLVGVPLAAAVYQMMGRDVRQWEAARGKTE